MDLSIVFVLATVVDLLALRLIPTRKRALRFVCISALFIVQTILIVGLIGSPFRPVFRVKDLPREFWLQLLACAWWALAAREMIGILALPEVLKKGPKENKILSDIIAACVYVCSGLAMMGFVFGLPLQGIVATSGGSDRRHPLPDAIAPPPVRRLGDAPGRSLLRCVRVARARKGPWALELGTVDGSD
jgi:hypothetical protein